MVLISITTRSIEWSKKLINLRRLLAVSRKETLHVIRDWRSLALAVAIPMILILLFGYALNLDLNNIPTVVWDQSGSPESRELLSLFTGSPYFSVTDSFDNYRDIQAALNSSRAMVAIIIPWDFAEKVNANKPVKVQVIADGSDANSARLALAYTNGIGKIYSMKVSSAAATFSGGNAAPVRLEQRAWYNTDLKSQHTIIPGIIAVVMMVIAAMLTSVTVAREWEMGTMEQLISTPIRAPELVLGKVVPYFVIGMLDVAIAVITGQLLFGVPLRGNTGLMFAISAIFLAGALFLGLLLSIVLKKQVIANQAALLAGYLPTLLLSGFVFAIYNMPQPIQWITYIVPARYFIVLMRGIFLKGIGLEIMWLDALLLLIFAAVMVILANKKMKLKLE
jgi:drug efflux transport system permease protein